MNNDKPFGNILPQKLDLSVGSKWTMSLQLEGGNGEISIALSSDQPEVVSVQSQLKFDTGSDPKTGYLVEFDVHALKQGTAIIKASLGEYSSKAMVEVAQVPELENLVGNSAPTYVVDAAVYEIQEAPIKDAIAVNKTRISGEPMVLKLESTYPEVASVPETATIPGNDNGPGFFPITTHALGVTEIKATFNNKTVSIVVQVIADIFRFKHITPNVLRMTKAGEEAEFTVHMTEAAPDNAVVYIEGYPNIDMPRYVIVPKEQSSATFKARSTGVPPTQPGGFQVGYNKMSQLVWVNPRG